MLTTVRWHSLQQFGMNGEVNKQMYRQTKINSSRRSVNVVIANNTPNAGGFYYERLACMRISYTSIVIVAMIERVWESIRSDIVILKACVHIC